MYIFRRQAFVLSSPAHAAGVPASPDTLCRRGTYFFTYGLPVASSRCLAIVRKRPLASVRCSVPPGASAIRTSSMALGCWVGCATKKVSKKVAGNAIPRSRLPSERKIAHSRVGSLYPHFDANVRSRGYFVKTTVHAAPAEPKQAQRSCRPPPGVAPA